MFLIGDDGDDDVLKPSEPEKVLDSSGSVKRREPILLR